MKISRARQDVSTCDGNVTDKTGIFWQVQEVLAPDTFRCSKFETRGFYTGVPLGAGFLLPWDSVGVKRLVEGFLFCE